MDGIDIFCGGCGDTATVTKVTAGLRHACGSTDIGVVGIDPMPKVAAPYGPGTGWGKAMPDPAANWSDYAGPGPGPNSVTSPPVADNMTCPTCQGAGYDINDKAICRECGGSGKVTATTSAPAVGQYDSHPGPPVGGARHAVVAGRPSTVDPYGTAEYQNMHGGGGYAGRGVPSGSFNPESEDSFYPKADSLSPGARVREQRDYSQGADRPYQLNEASCPECGHAPTELVKTPADRHGNQDAVWHCPSCGPLVNIDKNPTINPYRPHETGYAKPDRKALKTSRLAGLAEVTRSGKLLAIMASIQEHNTVTLAQSLMLARQTLMAYPEGRS